MSGPSCLIDEQFTKALKQLNKTEKGKMIIKKIINACHVNKHGFIPGDPYATAFQCGQRSIGLWLLSELECK